MPDEKEINAKAKKRFADTKVSKMGKRLVCKPALCPEPYIFSFFGATA